MHDADIGLRGVHSTTTRDATDGPIGAQDAAGKLLRVHGAAMHDAAAGRLGANGAATRDAAGSLAASDPFGGAHHAALAGGGGGGHHALDGEPMARFAARAADHQTGD